MARARTPANVLRLNGSAEHNKGRYADRLENEVIDENPVGDPPAWMNENEVITWHEFIEESIDGVLGRSDRKLLEVAARLGAKMRDDTLKTTEMNTYKTVIMQLGMTPCERSKVSVKKKPPKNKFDD